MPTKTNKIIENNIIKYYTTGYGTMYIAEKLNIHRATIQRILQRCNIALRKKSPQTHYNVNFFSEYGIQQAYWAGFILTDGSVRSNRNEVNIHLSIVDMPHLNKFSNAINRTGNIEIYDNSCRISISGEWFVNDLNNLTVLFHKKLTKQHFL